MFVFACTLGTRVKKLLTDRPRNRKIESLTHFNTSTRRLEQGLTLLGQEMSWEGMRIEL